MRATCCLLLLFFFTVAGQSLKAQSCDPWITQAYKELYNRTPSAEECNIRNYNNGSWNNYQELVSYIKTYNASKTAASVTTCDPWITKAYKELYNRTPTTQECNIKNYNNGSWNNYPELVGYIKNYVAKNTPVKKSVLKGDPWIFQAYKELYNRQPNAWELNVKNYNDGSWNNYAELKKYVKEFGASMEKAGLIIKTAPGKDNTHYVVFEQNGKPIAIDLVSAQGGTVVAAGGANVVSAGGANVVAAGSGNVVAAGSANFRITNDMAGINFGSKYTVQSTGATIVASSGKGALVIK
jgi:hypothetical protein